MTENEKKVLDGFLSKTFKLDTEALAGLYNEAGELTDLSAVTTADEERIKKHKDEVRNQYSRGLKEGAVKIEKELKDKFDVDSDELIGVELVEHILNAELEKVKTSKDEDVLNHPSVRKALNEKDKLLKQKDRDLEQRLQEKESEMLYASVFNRAKERALAELDNMNPILPEDAKKAQNLKSVFVRELEQMKYQEDGDDFIILGADGKKHEDNHGYSVAFSDYVKSIAEKYFDFKEADDRSSAGNKGTGQKPTSKRIISQSDYLKAMREAKTPEDRSKILKSFNVKP